MTGWVLTSALGASWPIAAFPAAIGREGMADLTVALTDPRVSRRHCEVYLDDGGRPRVRDLKSRNGTFVNGRRVTGTAPFNPGDTLKAGSTEFRIARAQPEPETHRYEVSSAYELDDMETRAVPYDALTRAASGLETHEPPDAAGAASSGGGTTRREGSSGLLYALGRSVAGLREPESIVDAVMSLAANVLHAERAAIFEPDGEGGLRALTGGAGGPAERLAPPEAAQSIVWRAIQLRQAVMFDQARLGPRSLSVSTINLEIRSALAVPLCVGDRTIGALYADTRADEEPLGDVQLELMGAIALQAAASLEAARRYREALSARRELDVANKRLREWGADLERRVHDRTREIEEKKREIEELLGDKNDLLRMVAHDLRMPLTSVVGYAQIAETDLDASDYDAVRERLQTILDVGRRTAYLLDDLLTAESIRSGQLAILKRQVDVGGLLERTAAAAELQAKEHGVELKTRSPADLPHALVDPGRLAQILDNLVQNAIKALRRGGIVELRASRDGATLVVEVADDGPGIESDVRDRLSQGSGHHIASAHGQGRRGTGFGLGLAIARKLTHLLGGRLAVDTTPQFGTTIAVLLPESFPEAQSGKGRSGARGAG